MNAQKVGAGSPSEVEVAGFETALLALQARLTSGLEQIDGNKFRSDRWQKSPTFFGNTMVLAGSVIEQGGVNFSRLEGTSLPATASARHPHLVNSPFSVRGVSVVIHPVNPMVPTAHMNIRLFTVGGDKPTYWFGGGFDLTPYYGNEDDVREFHQAAKKASERLHPSAYARFKKECDEYFYLKHRKEPRGVGGIFFDDLGPADEMTQNFSHASSFVVAVGNAFCDAYLAIVERRRAEPYSDRERQWQLYRRGRYVEFNLVFDRGTTFGLQTGGRTESILMSLPPLVRWEYDYKPEPGSREDALLTQFLVNREWA